MAARNAAWKFFKLSPTKIYLCILSFFAMLCSACFCSNCCCVLTILAAATFFFVVLKASFDPFFFCCHTSLKRELFWLSISNFFWSKITRQNVGRWPLRHPNSRLIECKWDISRDFQTPCSVRLRQSMNFTFIIKIYRAHWRHVSLSIFTYDMIEINNENHENKL